MKRVLLAAMTMVAAISNVWGLQWGSRSVWNNAPADQAPVDAHDLAAAQQQYQKTCQNVTGFVVESYEERPSQKKNEDGTTKDATLYLVHLVTSDGKVKAIANMEVALTPQPRPGQAVYVENGYFILDKTGFFWIGVPVLHAVKTAGASK